MTHDPSTCSCPCHAREQRRARSRHRLDYRAGREMALRGRPLPADRSDSYRQGYASVTQPTRAQEPPRGSHEGPPE